MTPYVGRKFALEKRQQDMTDLIAGVAQVGIAGIGRVREVLRSHIVHNFRSGTGEERADNPALTGRRDPS
jgi:hypothetical protein